MIRSAWALAAVVAGVTGPAWAQPPAPPVSSEAVPAPGDLIRAVVRSQRGAEKRLDSYTFDQLEETTTYRSDGSAKEVRKKLFFVFSAQGGGEGSRELVEVDGRPATEKEKREAAEEDRKAKRKLQDRAMAEAVEGARVQGDDDDPFVGPRRLSDLMTRFDVRVVGREELEGRPAWLVAFSPQKGVEEKVLGDRVLGALAGRAWVDASDLQVRRVEAHLLKPIKVAGGIVLSVKEAEVVYEAVPVAPGVWFPAEVTLRTHGKKALFFPLNSLHHVVLSNFRAFRVETESTTTSPDP